MHRECLFKGLKRLLTAFKSLEMTVLFFLNFDMGISVSCTWQLLATFCQNSEVLVIENVYRLAHKTCNALRKLYTTLCTNMVYSTSTVSVNDLRTLKKIQARKMCSIYDQLGTGIVNVQAIQND